MFKKIEAAEVEELKKRYAGKQQTAGDNPPASQPTVNGSAPRDEKLIAELLEQVTLQGEKVRKLKTEKADEATIKSEVATLLQLKGKLQEAGGDPNPNQGSSKKGKKKK